MAENHLLGDKYIQLNALLSAAVWNFKKWMKNTISLLVKYCFKIFWGAPSEISCSNDFRFFAA